MKTLARHVGITSQYKIARMPDDKRIGMLVAFVWAFEIRALDDALDVLDLLIADIAGEAKRVGKKKRLRTLKDLDQASLALADVVALMLNEEIADYQLREVIFAQRSKEQLEESIAVVADLARPPEDKFHEEMVAQYGRVKLFLQKLLNNVRFENAPAGATTMDVCNYLIELGPTRKQILDDAPIEIVSKPWRRLVFDKEGRVTKPGYTLCFLDKLQDSLRRRDLYVDNSDRWGDPRVKLLHGAEWQSQRIPVCRSLGHPVAPQEAIAKLTEQLDSTYQRVANNFGTNDAVRVDDSGKRPTLTMKDTGGGY